MAKEFKALIKLQVPAGSANPSPPIGPALGQHGLNIMDFCKQFNDRSKNEEKGTLLPVQISVYSDRTFDFIVKVPPVSELIKKKLGLKSGSGEPNKKKVGVLTIEDLKAIAEQKMPDLNAANITAAMHIIAGTARSMGIDVDGDINE